MAGDPRDTPDRAAIAFRRRSIATDGLPRFRRTAHVRKAERKHCRQRLVPCSNGEIKQNQSLIMNCALFSRSGCRIAIHDARNVGASGAFGSFLAIFPIKWPEKGPLAAWIPNHAFMSSAAHHEWISVPHLTWMAFCARFGAFSGSPQRRTPRRSHAAAGTRGGVLSGRSPARAPGQAFAALSLASACRPEIGRERSA